jgi:hypothetical protein
MSTAGLFLAGTFAHSFGMRQGWRWRALGGGLFGLALAACSFESSDENIDFGAPPPGDYMLGGQTGSLVPDCGVAPLSAGGITLPVGNALAVVYGRGCPEDLAAEQLALDGPGAPVALTLETLGDGVFLVRSQESLPAGQYELGVAGGQNTVSIGAEASPLPMRLGEIVPVTSASACPAEVELELTLGPEALAYAPLLRLLVSVDGGNEQLWVDYGALELADPESGRASLRLPRCSGSACLDGRHELRVRAELAGESANLEALFVRIDVPCDDPPPSDALPSDEAASSSCALGRSGAPSSAAWWCCVAGILWAARRRRH